MECQAIQSPIGRLRRARRVPKRSRIARVPRPVTWSTTTVLNRFASTAPPSRSLLAGGQFFWLDLDKPAAGDFEILSDVFRFHPLAVEDSEHFGQRAKIEDYDDFIFIVVYGAAPDDDRLVEVHCFYSERFLVTVHRDDCPAFAEIRGGTRSATSRSRSRRCCSTGSSTASSTASSRSSPTSTTASTSSRTGSSQADDSQLQEIFGMKRLLVGMRKAVTPAARHVRPSDGRRRRAARASSDEDERYFRDVYDHLIRISDLIDSYRDLLTGAMDVYLSTVSNRLNSVMKQLTMIATIFLPLTWLTGFFGQNFGSMVRHIGGSGSFLALGVGTEIARSSSSCSSTSSAAAGSNPTNAESRS